MTTTPSVPTVRPARSADTTPLGEVLARSFAHDPFFGWIAGDAPGAEGRMRAGWTAILRHASAGLSATWTTDDLAGAALWIPPDRPASGRLDSLRLGPAMGRLAGWGRVREVVAMLDHLEARRHAHLPAAHAYLSALGVDPGRQGQGIGTALVQPMLERCDRDGIPAYLETAEPRNVPLYERLGFRTVEELALPGTGVTGCLMIRA